MKAEAKKSSIQNLTLSAILTALVIVLQLMGSFIRFGPFSVSLVLVPIVIGAAVCGTRIGAWLGFVFGLTVLLSGDAAAFLALSVPGTVITVLLKGTLCGLAAGLVYKLVSKRNVYVGVIVAAIVCPIVNSGVFFLGCLVFFFNDLVTWAGGGDVVRYIILVLIGGNFLFELGFNILLSPIIVRLLRINKKLR